MPHTSTISAKIEVLIVEYNAIVKVLRTRKFKALQKTNFEAWWDRISVYQDRQEELSAEIDCLAQSTGEPVPIWDGAL
jgi:hypothetical protein